MSWKVKMFDFGNQSMKMVKVSQEDKALLRSNLSAWPMPGDGQEYMPCHMLLPFRSSSGPKAINLLSWCKAATKAKNIITHPPVRHMRLCRNAISRTYDFVWQLDFSDIHLELIRISSWGADDDSISLLFSAKTTVLSGFNRRVFQPTPKNQ